MYATRRHWVIFAEEIDPELQGRLFKLLEVVRGMVSSSHYYLTSLSFIYNFIYNSHNHQREFVLPYTSMFAR